MSIPYPPGSILGLKGTTSTSWAAFSIGTQGKIPYTSTHKKGVLISPSLFYDASLAQEDHVLWAIFDEAAVKRNGWDPRPPSVEEDLALSAPTIGELAKLIGVPGDALRETVRKYNTFVERGEDSDFGKPKTHLQYKTHRPPFYAVWMSIQVHDTNGVLL
jgi:hypothetical protein